MEVTLTTNGYEHAQVTGSGTCTLNNGGVISLSLGGDAFETNPTNVDLYGRVVHISSNGDVSYGYLSNSNLSYNSTTGTSSVSLDWTVPMPIYGILLPLDAIAN
jgi:hypothetical protein